MAIYDFGVRTKLDPEYKDAQLWIRPVIDVCNGADTKGWKVAAKLYDPSGAAVEGNMEIYVDEILSEKYPQRDNVHYPLLQQEVKDPLKWTAETPVLYTLVLSLLDGDSKLVEARSCKVGFRDIRIEGHGNTKKAKQAQNISERHWQKFRKQTQSNFTSIHMADR